jgi:hypothetical protein
VTGWLAYSWPEPVYYGYGTGGNVYYEGDTVYVDGTADCSAEEYYEQASTLATSVPEIPEQQAEQVEWLSLGVFAVTQEDVDESDMMLQLAVSKEGIIGGTAFNETTGVSRPVEGTVDQKTQRAAWTFADGKNTDVVMETGVYNLTQDETTMLVHFGSDQTQSWVLVRLDEPESEGADAAQGATQNGG